MPADGAPATTFRAVVLDFDGVVVESNHIKTVAFERVFADYPEHAAAMMAHHRANISDSRYKKFRHLAVDLLESPDPDAVVADLAERFTGHVASQVEECELVPGAEAFLSEFSERVPLYLASVTPQPELERILARRGLRKWFREIFGEPPTPKRDALRRVVESGGYTQKEVVLVGDSPGDMLAARDAGVEFVARDSGIPFAEPPPEIYPDLHAVAAALRPRIA